MTHWLTNRCKPWIWESLTSWLKWWFVSSRLIFHVLLTRTSLVFFDRIFPESLRWLLATQQYCRSKWIMGHIAKKNRVNMELDADNILTGNKTLLIFHEIFTDSSSKLFLFLHWSTPPPDCAFSQISQIDKAISLFLSGCHSNRCRTLHYDTVEGSLISLQPGWLDMSWHVGVQTADGLRSGTLTPWG